MLRSLFWFVQRAADAAVASRPLAPENARLPILKYILYCGLNRKRELRLRCFGEAVTIRTATYDLRVAMESFLDEYAGVARALDRETAFIIDAGGYIGTSALFFARRFPRARIVVLEPSAENFRLLVENTSGVDRILPVRKALGAAAGTGTLRDSGTGEWGYTLHVPEGSGPAPDEEVEVTTIDALLAQAGAERVDLLKLDIEGSERDLVAAGPAALERVDAVVCELHERIAPGATRALMEATRGWRDRGAGSEKIFTTRT